MNAQELHYFAKWAAAAPPGALVPAAFIAECLAARSEDAPDTSDASAGPEPITWRERLWTVPTETRFGVVELCEALDRPRSFVYRHTSSKSGLSLLPHRKLDGELVFVAGEIRGWIQSNETVLVPGRPLLELRRGA